jgi:Arc/MetJ-type ribon-helix-helix transcriptional regulator
MDVKVNLMMPEFLYKESLALVKKGMFSNYSELVRQAVRSEVSKYREREFTEKDKRLFELLKRMEKDGRLLTEEQMAEHGLKI